MNPISTSSVPAPSATTPSPSSKAVLAGRMFDSMDLRGDGTLSKSDFTGIFLALNGGAQGASDVSATHYTIAPIRFVETERPTFLVTTAFDAVRSLAERQAALLFSSIDRDGSGAITRDEFVQHFAPSPTGATGATGATAPPPGATGATGSTDPTAGPSGATGASGATGTGGVIDLSVPSSTGTDPAAEAAAILARYDAAGKGYFDEADLVAAWTVDPSLGDLSKASETIKAWDDNGDGKVTKDEVVNGLSVMAYADQMLAEFAPAGNGFIALSNVSDQNSAGMSHALETLTAWDRNADGQVSRQELIDGIHALNASAASGSAGSGSGQIATPDDPEALFKTYDENGDRSIDASELAGAAKESGSDPAVMMSAWDANGNGSISRQEFTDGYNAIKQASAIVASYDGAGKGWFDKADIEAAIASDPTANAGANADAIMAAWDSNGDGKVTVPEVIAGLAAGGMAGTTPNAGASSSDMPSVSDTLAAVGLTA